jgi:hypothetical protein
MKILKIIGIAVAGLIALFLIVTLFLPSSFRVERAVEINVPPEVVFGQVVNLPNWPKWDPFTEQEPAAKSTFNGEAGTIGSRWDWEGKVIGTGSLTVEEIVPNQSIRSKMVSVAPQPWVAMDNWRFEASANGTKVTWMIDGNLGYPVERIIGLFMEGMLGPTMEKGLSNLKKHSESVHAEKLSMSDPNN